MFTRRFLLNLIALLPVSLSILPKRLRAESHMIDYSLQERVEGLTIPDAITVVGCGGFGCWPAFFSAMAGVKELLLIDAGDVEANDLVRTIYRPSDIGRPKAEALAELIQTYRPDAQVTAQKRFVEPTDDDIFVGSVLFDGTDYAPLSSVLPQAARSHNMRFVHAYYLGTAVGVSDYFPEGMEYTHGSVSPVWPGSAALAGLLAINSAYVSPMNFAGTPASMNMSRETFEAFRESSLEKPAK